MGGAATRRALHPDVASALAHSIVTGASVQTAGEGISGCGDAPAPSLDVFAPFARHLLAGSLLFLGVLHVIFGERLSRMMPAWPDGLPGRPLWAHAGGALIAIGAGMMFIRGRERRTAVPLTALLLLPVLGLHLPRALPSGTFGDAWLNVVKWLAMAAAPLVLAWHVPAVHEARWKERVISTGAALAPWIMGAFMLGSAVLHVRYAEFVAELMQPWLPWRLFWTYFAAVALAAGGLGLVIPKTARLAALLTSLMIFSWFWLVHTPRMLVDPTGPVGWSEMGESLAFSALVFLLAVRADRRQPR
jgi:uncharacterized membrane protein